MRVLCLGNNTTDTETKTISLSNGGCYNGVLTDITQEINDGYYQTSVFDLSRADILEVAKKFDKIVILDQPREEYSHPDSFYITIDIGKKLSAEFLNHQYCDDINFFDDLVKENSSFCIFPFIELLANNNHTNVCCRSNKPVAELKNLNFVHNKQYQSIRQRMLDGTPIPEYCSSCYDLEALGIKSARQQETVEWANRLNLKSIEDLTNITSPSYYEVRASNICNLQCRSCGPNNSSEIEKEYKVIGLIDKHYRGSEYSDFSFVEFNGLKKLYVSGGEPTIMIEFHKFLERCIAEQNTDFELLINTNATKLSNKFRDYINYFKNAGFVVSIDGLRDQNYYIRWPSNWENIISNVDWISKSKHVLAFNITVSIYNILNLFDILKFLEERYPAAIIHCQLADSDGDILSPFNYVGLDLAQLEKIKELKCYTNTELLKTFVDGLIETFHSAKLDLTKLTKFFTFNDLLDQSRNIKLIDYIPELERLRNEI